MAGTASYINPPISADYRFSVEDLLNVIPDNTANLIDAKDVRDSVWTLWNRIDDIQIIASQSLLFNNDYVRSTPTPISVGGVSLGTTFSGTIQDALDKLLYPYVSQSNIFSVSSGSTRQFGSSLSVLLNWTVIKNSNPILSITVDGSSVVPTGSSQSGNKLVTATHSLVPSGVTEVQTWTMTTSDGTSVVNTNTSITWMNKRYWGFVDLSSASPSNPDLTMFPGDAASIGSYITDNIVKGLTGAGVGTGNELSSTLSKTYTNINASGNYLCFAWPTQFGNPTFVVGGFTNTAFTKVRSNVVFVNEWGFSGVNYDVWISNTAYNSPATVVVS